MSTPDTTTHEDIVHMAYGTVFNCMDGRCQEVPSRYLREKYGVRYVDAINFAGLDGMLAGKTIHPEQPSLNFIKFEAEVSARKHGSKHAIFVGHDDCGGNPVSNEDHIADIRASVEVIKSFDLFETVEGFLATEGEGGEWVLTPLP